MPCLISWIYYTSVVNGSILGFDKTIDDVRFGKVAFRVSHYNEEMKKVNTMFFEHLKIVEV